MTASCLSFVLWEYTLSSKVTTCLSILYRLLYLLTQEISDPAQKSKSNAQACFQPPWYGLVSGPMAPPRVQEPPLKGGPIPGNSISLRAPSALAPFTWGWSNFGWSETTDQKNGHPPLAPKWLLASPRFPARARIALESDKKPFFDSTTPVIWSPVRSSGHWTSLDR